jgi:hypothetical protein
MCAKRIEVVTSEVKNAEEVKEKGPFGSSGFKTGPPPNRIQIWRFQNWALTGRMRFLLLLGTCTMTCK